MNKEVFKVLAINVSKFAAIIIGVFGVTVGSAYLGNYLFGWDKQLTHLGAFLAILLGIGLWTAYDYAKWKVDFDTKYGNK